MENTEPNKVTEPVTNDNTIHTLPKPILEQDKRNWVRKSLISLAIYGVLFLFIFKIEPAYIAALLTALLIHEFGHFFAMKAFNYTNVKLFVLPMLGAYVTGKKTLISQRQMSIVILAGPVPGIIIGACLLLSTYYYPNDKIEMLGNIFLGLNLFNLLPFIPLDGGRLLETLFINQNHVLRVVFTIISIIALIIMAYLTKSLFFVIIPVSMVFDLIMEIKNEKIRNYLDQEHINYTTNYSDLPDKDYWTIRDCVLLSFSKRYASIEPGVQSYSMLEGGIIQHISTILKTPFIKDLKTLEKIGIVISYILFLIIVPFTLYIILKL